MSWSVLAAYGDLFPFFARPRAAADADPDAGEALHRAADAAFEAFVRRRAAAAWQLLRGLLEPEAIPIELERILSRAWERGERSEEEVLRGVVQACRRPHPEALSPEAFAALLTTPGSEGTGVAELRRWSAAALAEPELRRRLRGWLRRLPEPYRSAVWLRDVAGLPKARTAQLLDLPPAELGRSLDQGRRALRTHIDQALREGS